MTREPNVYDLESQGLMRHHKHNPLFDVLTEEFDNALKESKVSDDHVVDNYYVDERDDTNVTNDAIFRHFPRGVKMVTGTASFVTEMSDEVGMVYLLIGKKGMGKTTLLKYYCKKVLNTIERDEKSKTVSIYLDLKNRKSDAEFVSGLPGSLKKEIYGYIDDKIPRISKYLTNPEYIKKIDKRYEHLSNDRLVERSLDNKEEVINYLFRHLKSQRFELVLIVDNIDDFGKPSVISIMDMCQRMKDQYNAKCIVAVRDYWTPRGLGIDDSKLCALHLSKPNIRKIMKRRLEDIDARSATMGIKFDYDNKPIELTGTDFIDTFDRIVDELMRNPNTLQEQLYELTNYDTREFLENLYYYFHSPYLYSRPNFIKTLLDKIRKIDKDFSIESHRPTRFFDYIECFMTPHALCYDINDSNIFNIFFHKQHYDEGYNYKNALIFVRILQIAPERMTPNTVTKEYIIAQLKPVGYYDEKAIENAISILLTEGLLESPDGRDYKDVQDLKLSAKGELYIKRLVYEYSYIVFACDQVPMPEEYRVDIHKKFGNEYIPLERGDLLLKHESVRRFIRFIENEEGEEKRRCIKDHRLILDRITCSSSLSEEMRDVVETTIRKMMSTSGNRRVKKITSVTKLKS